jgi:hypothetical protein
MVSLNDRQALAVMAEADQQLKRLQLLLDGERATVAGSAGDGLHGQLLGAIAANESARFKEVAGELGRRKIKPESDWCHDDYLLFLLLLGKEKFGCPLPFLAQVMEVRRKNANPVPRKINEVFAALDREEFGFEGEFGFLKIPFLHLVGKLRVGPAEAKKALQEMSAPGLFDQMSPFLKLLTRKAHDLVLLERQPVPTETAAQLIEGIEAHAKNLSLRNWWRIFTALPGRFIWGLVLVVVAVVPILFGVGKGIVDAYYPKEARSRPATIAVTGVREPGPELPAEALIVAKALPQPAGTGKRSIVVSVQAAPFLTATPAFVIEASHPTKSIRNAFAFVLGAPDGEQGFTVVPVQRDGGRFRALLPQQSKGRILNFVLEMEVEATEESNSVGKEVVLRPLE